MSSEYDDFEFEITDPREEAENLYYNFLIYANSGTGKTVFAGSDRRCLFIAPERHGILSAVRMGSKLKQVKIKHWEHFRKSIDHLEAHPEILKDFDWLVIDSLSEMEKMLKRAILEAEAPGRVAKDQDIDQLQIQDYGKAYQLMEAVVYRANDLPVNVLYTALATAKETPDHKEFLTPMLGSTDKKKYDLPMKIVSMMTSFGYMTNETVEMPVPTEENPDAIQLVRQRRIYWDDTGKITGKDRTTRLGPFTVDATLQQVRRCADGTLVRGANGTIVKPGVKTAPAAKPQPPVKVEEVKSDEDKTSPQADEPVDSDTDGKEPPMPAVEPEKESGTTESEDKQPETVEA